MLGQVADVAAFRLPGSVRSLKCSDTTAWLAGSDTSHVVCLRLKDVPPEQARALLARSRGVRVLKYFYSDDSREDMDEAARVLEDLRSTVRWLTVSGMVFQAGVVVHAPDAGQIPAFVHPDLFALGVRFHSPPEGENVVTLIQRMLPYLPNLPMVVLTFGMDFPTVTKAEVDGALADTQNVGEVQIRLHRANMAYVWSGREDNENDQLE